MKTARITATAAIGLMLFIGISIMLAVLLASPSSQADAPSDTLNISPVSEVLTGYTLSAADETLPTPANCSGCDSPNIKRRFLYNGQWIDPATIPYVLSDWQITTLEQAYDGQMIRGAEMRTAMNGRDAAKNAITAGGVK